MKQVLQSSLFIIVFTGFLSVSVHSQSTLEIERPDKELYEYLKRTGQLDTTASEVNSQKLKDLESINFPAEEIWNKTPWPDPAFNFFPTQIPRRAGDINGDGFEDFYFKANATNERSSFIVADEIEKYFFYWGGEELNREYDQILYRTSSPSTNSQGYPLGDLTSDTFSDFLLSHSGGIEFLEGASEGLRRNSLYDSLENAVILDLVDKVNSRTLFNDIDGDGDRDISGTFNTFNFEKNVSEYYYYTYSPDTSLGTTSYSELLIPDSGRTFLLGQQVVSGDTLLTFFDQNSGRQFVIDTYIKENDSLRAVDQLIFPPEPVSSQLSPETLFFEDFNGDGIKDLMFYSRISPFLGAPPTYYLVNGNAAFTIDLTDDDFFEVSDVSLFPDHPLLNPADSLYNLLVPITDIDGDGRTEFVLRSFDNKKIFVAHLSSASSEPAIEIEHEFDLEPIFGGEASASVIEVQDNIANYTGKPFSWPFRVETDSLYITAFLEIDTLENAGASNYSIAHFEYRKRDFDRTTINEIFLLGDPEQDGIDNFGLEMTTTLGEAYLRVYNGFREEDYVDIQVESPSDYTILEATAGHFLSQETQHIALLLGETTTSNELNDQLLIYAMDDLKNPSHIITPSDLDPELEGMRVISSLGDINNDGYDDLGISAPNTNQFLKLFIFLGGEELSESPDIVIDYSAPEYPGETANRGISVVQDVGDINGDGIDDFVTGDPRRDILGIGSFSAAGAFYLHYGQDSELPDFTIADEMFYPDTTTREETAIYLGVNEIAHGDFNGDGLQDIATFPAWKLNGGDFKFYYQTENGFNSQPDITLGSSWSFTPSRLNFIGGGYLSSVEDLNGDGRDELLYVPGGNSRREGAYLYNYDENNFDNKLTFFGNIGGSRDYAFATYVSGQQERTVIGDFTGDGVQSFIVFQRAFHYRDMPIYRFELGATVVSTEATETPITFGLEQNYPNPFNPSTNIEFSIPQASHVSLTVYNVLGQKVSQLIDNRMSVGSHTVNFDASALASGLYIYRLEAGEQIQTKKMMLIK